MKKCTRQKQVGSPKAFSEPALISYIKPFLGTKSYPYFFAEAAWRSSIRRVR